MNLGQIKTSVRTNLNDNGVTFWTDTDFNDSFQDAYDDVVCLSQCVVKSTTLSWIANLSYYDVVVDCGVLDYLATVAIFNYATNRWLRDDLNLRDFDKFRKDWETWSGTPQFWASSDFSRIAVAPKYITSIPTPGTFKLVYWTTAPVLFTDGDNFLMASDAQTLLEYYVSADMLEQAQEFSKAAEYWEKYYTDLEEYSDRVKCNNRSDLLLRV